MLPCYRTFLALILLLLLEACGSAPFPQQLPERQVQADAADRQARRVLREGDLQSARVLFEQSLRMQRSLDNLPGIASATVNLAVVYHRLKDDKLAVRLLDGIIEEKMIPYPPDLQSVAAFRKAVILVDSGDREAALAVDIAAKLCSGSCQEVAGISNLRARLALAGKDYAAAEKYARSAADAVGANREELANARRNAARAEAAQGKFGPALDDYLAALQLDKQLGLPPRIAADLGGAAEVLDKLGRKEESAAYARRATAVMSAISDSVDAAPVR